MRALAEQANQMTFAKISNKSSERSLIFKGPKNISDFHYYFCKRKGSLSSLCDLPNEDYASQPYKPAQASLSADLTTEMVVMLYLYLSLFENE
jgi:hypothetical protein